MPLFQRVAALLGATGCADKISADVQEDPVFDVPERRARVLRIAALLPDFTKEVAEELVLKPAVAFARRVLDLPASERHHHSDPWGLLDHSLEVAEYAVRGALSSHFVDHAAPNPEEQEFRVPRLRYASLILGLNHDVGKILHVIVQSEGELWNPYAEGLQDFAFRHAGHSRSLLWRAGRGADAHVWHTAYLLGMFLTDDMAAYLGASLLSEVLEGRTPAAVRVRDLVKEADSRSTQEDLARKARREVAPPADETRTTYFEPAVGYAELVPRAFAEAWGESLFGANRASGDLWVGAEYVAFRYPAAVAKLAGIIRERLGPVSIKARMLPIGEAGARELAHHLAEHGVLFKDQATGSWKLSMAVSGGGDFEATAAILVRRAFLLSKGDSATALEAFAGGVVLRRTTDHSEVVAPGFHSVDRPVAVLSVPEKKLRPPASPASDVLPLPEGPPSAPPPPAYAASLRAHVVPGILLEDIRRGILDGTIPANAWNAPVYVLEDRTYFVSPTGFRRLVDQGLYSLDPSTHVNTYLDALGKLDCVRKFGQGRVLTRITLRPGAKSCCVVVFETLGLFQSQAELARIGIWKETEIKQEDSPPFAPATAPKEAGNDV